MQRECGQVQSYKRKITYFYQYHNGTVGSTAGFLKLEIRGEKVKIIINIQEPPGLPYKEASLYFYHEAGDHLAAVKVDRVESRNGILTYLNRTDWQQIFNTGRDLYTFDGIVVMYNENHYYIGDFQDKDRRDYEIVIKEPRRETQAYYVPESELKVVAQPEVAGLFGDTDKTNVSPQETRMAHEPQKDIVIDRKIVGQSRELVGRENGRSAEKIEELPEVDSRQTAVERMESEEVESAVAQRMEQEEAKSAFAQAELKGNEQPDMQHQTEHIPLHSESKDDSLYEKCENCPYHKKHMEKQEQVDAFEKMLEEYPKLPMYGATELFDCVRIHPKDIGKLDMRNWKLGVNSFLTHGFYTYQYLLLGKMRFGDGNTRPIIGVPGIYSNREKYLANMFGFEQFIPVKKTSIKTGEFGYWIVEISPYL